ncbi:MAG: carbamoyl-phosphate synthase large subunit [Deltaproteobacteria bacterium]|nr:carbamoyl-phosphate synthase large subunit [Deltaproteobacteria bacterium]
MPARRDIEKILLIGSGPIVIGQACEFDYSGTQACKALREEGYCVILVNSNPATIMTDEATADITYIEPLTLESLAAIIEKERPHALLPTVGGQTALNLAQQLAEGGVLDDYGVELIGADIDVIRKAENRELFRNLMIEAGIHVPNGGLARSLDEAWEVVWKIGFPAVIRPAFTLGGSGGNIAYNRDEFANFAPFGLSASPIGQILVEESIAGWKEFELEVMRDAADNFVVVCSIENLDPMGIHTGDSITVAPAQTLSDAEYQRMRDTARRVISTIGVQTGGANIQFAVDPKSGKQIVIEMNPRVSRSSALASKATGFPIAKIAARLAVGCTLPEIPNDITRKTPASFEPSLDYVVTKIPRFAFEKFPATQNLLTTQMKSVGEVMGIGRTFPESLQKAIRSLEERVEGLEWRWGPCSDSDLRKRVVFPNSERLWAVAEEMRRGIAVEELYKITAIDPWFLRNIEGIVKMEKKLRDSPLSSTEVSSALRREALSSLLLSAKQMGFSDQRIADLTGLSREEIRALRKAHHIEPIYNAVDTCAAEFEACTPYLYSTYERGRDEAKPTSKKKVVILGSGPNRIGQGIEFDYCCVHASFALRELGFETIMINCNPETVSTDYDTSDRLYFEPLTAEDVIAILDREKPEGVILQLGGQTPLQLSGAIAKAGFPVWGTSPDSIDRAEDRKKFKEILTHLNIRQPINAAASSAEEGMTIARTLGLPLIIRPSYVLGGRAMEIIHEDKSLQRSLKRAMSASPRQSILLEQFLVDAIEVDVDALCDGREVYIAAVMEHIEEAGIHSGDSACSIPPQTLSSALLTEIERIVTEISLELHIKGLVNAQLAIRRNEVYLIEINPRASRTVPYVSKTIGLPLAKLAVQIMAGFTLKDLNLLPKKGAKADGDGNKRPFSIKMPVFPFVKFPGSDTILGPEMLSTGEVMGFGKNFGEAYAKACIAAGNPLPLSGTLFLSVKDDDKPKSLPLARRFIELGFKIVATQGTARYLHERGISSEMVNKVAEGRPHIVDLLVNGEIDLVINTTIGAQATADSYSIRRTTLLKGIPYFTTLSGAKAGSDAIFVMQNEALKPGLPLQRLRK